jgi:hypothetical protein
MLQTVNTLDKSKCEDMKVTCVQITRRTKAHAKKTNHGILIQVTRAGGPIQICLCQDPPLCAPSAPTKAFGVGMVLSYY